MKTKTLNLKSIVFLLLLLTVAGKAKAQQWDELQTGVTEEIYGLYCIDTNTVFACGANGVILKTEDGGNSWQEKYRQEGYYWYSIKFLDPNIGFVLGINDDIGNNEKLFKTIDGGETWLDMGNPFNEYNYCSPSTCDLFIVDADTMYVACDKLMKSTDGGCSFSQLNIEWTHAIQELYFEGNIGYVVWGKSGDLAGTHIAKTTDYGSSWEEILTFDSEHEGINKTMFHDKDHVSIYGAFDYNENELYYEYNELRTEDGFVTYQLLRNEDLLLNWWPPVSGVCFSDSQNGIIVYYWEDFSYPYSGIISYQTQDGGNTWIELNALDDSGLGYPDISGHEGVYYLAGRGVYKMKTTTEGISEERECVFAFPNPTSNTLFIYGKGNSDLIMYDFSGQILFQQKITDEIQKIETSGFPSGIYFLGIKNSGGNVSFQKIVKK
jgi:photosystem II stability/assembly factor-like uncharacterized protein